MSRRYPQLADAAWLRRCYEAEQWSTTRIAETVGCSVSTARTALIRAGIPLRPAAQPFPGGSKYPKLLDHAWLLEQYVEKRRSLPDIAAEIGCGVTAVASHLNRAGVPMRDRREGYQTWRQQRAIELAGEPSRRYVTVQGYVRLSFIQPDGSHVRITEHRHVMQQMLGRELLPWESVHHINGDRADNRPDNLQLRQGSHGAGVHLTCNSCGSHDVSAVPI